MNKCTARKLIVFAQKLLVLGSKLVVLGLKLTVQRRCTIALSI